MNQTRTISILAAVVIWASLPQVGFVATIKESLEYIASSPKFIELAASDGLAVDLRYATSNNFVGKNLYGDLNKAFAHKVAAHKLARAAANLKRIHPKYKLVVFDASR
jgi:D-alanyl-D-alanine dipeptidase